MYQVLRVRKGTSLSYLGEIMLPYNPVLKYGFLIQPRQVWFLFLFLFFFFTKSLIPR